MSLSDLSQGYRDSAELLSNRLASLRAQLKDATDPEQVFSLKRRIAELTPMLTEMNALAELTERYYDKEYYRDERYSSNCFQAIRRGTQEAKRNFDEYYPSGADGAPAGYFCTVLSRRSEDRADCNKPGCEQKYRKSYPKESRAESTSDYSVPVEVLDKFF